ncbi:MAG TPA: YbhB/YbcL family Raf kinase inhibitor-like protein [Thermoanaerobaculaceae bacterium]|nr:YbhB/YbcL family Raf kinase inhibitor-like protein [Thermoanaerobaculaceae bacterium]
MRKAFDVLVGGLALTALALPAAGQTRGEAALVTDPSPEAREMRLSSTTFDDGSTLPLSMVYNQCPFVSGGGNTSPELSWSGAPHRTKSFVVVAFDVTAAFTHWGMYNIPRGVTELRANAGAAGSPYGAQVWNDFFLGAEYDGPCPPPSVAPVVHDYEFTVYALDTTLTLPGSANFPPDAETLWRALLGHVLDSASIHGFYSTAP